MWMPPVYGIVWQGCRNCPYMGQYGKVAPISLRAKCRLRRLHSDTRLWAQPQEEAFLTKTPPHLAARGLKFNFYCSFALMAASIARAASLPAPMARMTVAAPVTASPPA